MPPASGASHAPPQDESPALSGRGHRQAFLVLLGGMALLVLVASLFAYGAIKILSGGRAYVHGEGRWSKAQQEAVFFLDRYAEGGRPEDLARARRALRGPLGDRQARLALQGPAYDPERAREGFRQGGNEPGDIPTMIWLFEHFERAPYFREAIRIWTDADRDILRLTGIADQLERHWRTGAESSSINAPALRAELARVDRRLRMYETQFSATLNTGLRLLERSVLVAGAGLMMVLLALALLMFRWATRRIRASEQKFWASFAHAPVGFALLSRDGHCSEVNDALCRQLGWPRAQLVGARLEQALGPEDPGPLARALSRDDHAARRLELCCRDAAGRPMWAELDVCPLPANGDVGEAFVVLFKDVSEERRHRERLSWAATHDDLTGLCNRSRFEQELETSLRGTDDESRHVLGFLDLDHFKEINDSWGHAAGDEVLKALASIMRDRLRSSDVLARLGGDEFGFLLRECPLERGEAIAESLRAAIARHEIGRDDRRFAVTTSIGLVSLDERTPDATTALQEADDACYRAKDRGRNRIEVMRDDP